MKKENIRKVAAMSVSAIIMLSLMSAPIQALDEETVNGEEVVEEVVEAEETSQEQVVVQSEKTRNTQTSIAYKEGVTVEADAESPTGYTAHFVYNYNNDDRLKKPEGYDVITVELHGSFKLLSGVKDYDNDHSLYDYKNGDFVANSHPIQRGDEGVRGSGEWTFKMEDAGNGYYTLDVPMVSGAHYYYYNISYANEAGEVYQDYVYNYWIGTYFGNYVDSVDDPANPSPCRENEKNSDSETSDITHSMVYGKWDPVKQSQSPNLDIMTPYDGPRGTVEYKTYSGTISNHQDLGIYLPPNYDPDRAEPYKVIYLSHGMGGNETYWFSQPQAGNVMDHVIAENPDKEAIVVGMDNTLYDWDYYQIGQNVVNYIIPFMEANYNVSTNPEDRAFGGFSMGSMTATYMAFHHADQFGYFGIFSGCNI
ncbi:MAG: alpha/beta hydrolase, partial [Faecalibacillus sp.]